MPNTLNFSTGIHAVQELLKTQPENIESCIILTTSPNARLKSCMTLASQQKIPLKNTAPTIICNKLNDIKHQNIIAIHKNKIKPSSNLMSLVAEKGDDLQIVILDGVQDPRNLGACIRSACANNCHAIIIPKNNNATITELVTKIACGACAILPIFEVANIHQTLTKLKKANVWCWGLTEHTDAAITNADFSGPTALVFGTESTGLRELSKKTCDYLIKIPTNNKFASLNLAVSVGIATFVVQTKKLNMNSKSKT